MPNWLHGHYWLVITYDSYSDTDELYFHNDTHTGSDSNTDCDTEPSACAITISIRLSVSITSTEFCQIAVLNVNKLFFTNSYVAVKKFTTCIILTTFHRVKIKTLNLLQSLMFICYNIASGRKLMTEMLRMSYIGADKAQFNKTQFMSYLGWYSTME